MKLIYAGESSTFSNDPNNFLFNCTRNPRCQKKYFIPLKHARELQLYVDLPGKPSSYSSQIVDICSVDCSEEPGDFSDDFNDDFDIGGDNCHNPGESIIWAGYVVAQTAQGNWFGVFTDPKATPILTGKLNDRCFYVKMTFEINGIEHVFYSNHYCVDPCDPLCLLKACYPNESVGSDAFDCNGLYYGFHAGNDTPLGNPLIRYWHKLYLRKCSVFGKTKKLSFTYFNSKRNYKTISEKEQTLQAELVPEFYANNIFAIYERGQIRVNETEYKLSKEQTWQVLDEDSKLWDPTALLFEECKQIFGCSPADCLPPEIEESCENNVELSDWDMTGPEACFRQTFIGTFNIGDHVEWELYEVNPVDQSETLVDSGEFEPPPLEFVSCAATPATKCYKVRWKINCLSGTTAWKEAKFGVCEAPIEGTVSMYSFGGGVEGSSQQCRAQGATKLRFRFTGPTPANIVLKVAYVAHYGSSPYQGEGNQVLDPSHPDFAGAYSNLGQGKPFDITIPAGSTDYTTPLLEYASPFFPVTVQMLSFPLCNPSFGNTFDARLYFRVISPAGGTYVFTPVFDTPAPWAVKNNSFTFTQVP